MEKRLSTALQRVELCRTEMVKFEPEAMRALVKYKLLKKQIAQCIDRRDKPHIPDREITPPTEEEIKANVVAMQTSVL